MTPSKYKTLIQNKHLEITSTPLQLSDDDFQYFTDIAKYTNSGESVLNNYEKFLRSESDHSPKLFFEWYVDLVLGSEG